MRGGSQTAITTICEWKTITRLYTDNGVAQLKFGYCFVVLSFPSHFKIPKLTRCAGKWKRAPFDNYSRLLGISWIGEFLHCLHGFFKEITTIHHVQCVITSKCSIFQNTFSLLYVHLYQRRNIARENYFTVKLTQCREVWDQFRLQFKLLPISIKLIHLIPSFFLVENRTNTILVSLFNVCIASNIREFGSPLVCLLFS